MRKPKKTHPLLKQGFEFFPGVSGKIVDSIWVNNEKQELIIRFSWGGSLRYAPKGSEEPEMGHGIF